MPYVVMVDDNARYQDEEARYEHGRFDDPAEAVAHCVRIVEECLDSLHQAGMSAAELYDHYKLFGDDPFILCSGVPYVPFSAWSHARRRCEALCARQVH